MKNKNVTRCVYVYVYIYQIATQYEKMDSELQTLLNEYTIVKEKIVKHLNTLVHPNEKYDALRNLSKDQIYKTYNGESENYFFSREDFYAKLLNFCNNGVGNILGEKICALKICTLLMEELYFGENNCVKDCGFEASFILKKVKIIIKGNDLIYNIRFDDCVEIRSPYFSDDVPDDFPFMKVINGNDEQANEILKKIGIDQNEFSMILCVLPLCILMLAFPEQNI